MKSIVLLLLALASASVVFGACQRADDDHLPEIAGLENFDSLNYYRDVPHALQLFDVEASPVPDDDAWRALVRRQRADGLRSLSDGDRLRLLAHAMKAYLYLVHDARFRYTSGDMNSFAQETYQKEVSTGLYLGFRKRHATYAGIQVEWGGTLLGLSGSLEEQTDVLEESAENPDGHRWSVRGGVVTCVDLDSDDGGMGFLQTAYFQRYSAPANGRVRKSSDFQGRDVETVIVSYPDGSEVTYWLDRISLFPVRWIDDRAALPDESRLSLTADLLAINQAPTTEPPSLRCE